MTTTATRRQKCYLPAFAVVFVAVFILSIGIGQYPVPLGSVLHVLFDRLAGAPSGAPTSAELIVWQIRLPRLVAVALVGAGLTVAGAGFQGLFRNPMASPDILGASAGSGFGAALALLASAGFAVVSASAFIGGLIAVGIAYVISTRARRKPTLGLVLAGIMVASLFNAGTSYVKLVADPSNVLPAITFWLMGSFASIQWVQVLWAAGPIMGAVLILLIMRWRLNLLTMGEDDAHSMGVNTNVARALIIGCATLVTATSVAISGLVGWVGLVIPHFARLLVGDDNRRMMPVAMLMGASFLIGVDDLARTLTTAEIPIGILTAFVGAPFFLYLMMNKGGRM